MSKTAKTWEWIPIKQNIYPEDDWEVLISGKTYDEEPVVCMGEYYSSLDIWSTDDPACERVCAWMEKPDSYEEEDVSE